MKVFTIGFTRKTAERFFTLLSEAGVRRVLDVRRHNESQLAGFSKGPDLEFFLRRIGQIDYRRMLDLAPTEELLTAYRKGKVGWAQYEPRFFRLMRSRRIEQSVSRDLIDGGCLLCSEHEPTHCHRRLVAEYLQAKWDDLEIEHLT